MERRYLVAALAIIATFAVFSHGLRTLERVSLTYGQRAEAKLQAKCNAEDSAVSRFVGKVRTHLRPGYAEEAQMLAEMNLPIVRAQAKVAEQMARQNMAAAQCARATALREAERAQREATRMRERMARTNGSGMTIAWEANMAGDVNQRVQAKTAALAERIAAQTVRLQIAADQMREVSMQFSDSDAANADYADAGQDSDTYASDGGSRNHCDAAQARAQQSAQAIRTRSRAVVNQIVHSLGYR